MWGVSVLGGSMCVRSVCAWCDECVCERGVCVCVVCVCGVCVCVRGVLTVLVTVGLKCWDPGGIWRVLHGLPKRLRLPSVESGAAQPSATTDAYSASISHHRCIQHSHQPPQMHTAQPSATTDAALNSCSFELPGVTTTRVGHHAHVHR